MCVINEALLPLSAKRVVWIFLLRVMGCINNKTADWWSQWLVFTGISVMQFRKVWFDPWKAL